MLPQSLQKKRSPANTLILDFCPPELQDDKCVPCEDTKFVVICYSSRERNALSFSRHTPAPPCQASQTLLGGPTSFLSPIRTLCGSYTF